jgi:flagellar motor protein MotB
MKEDKTMKKCNLKLTGIILFTLLTTAAMAQLRVKVSPERVEAGNGTMDVSLVFDLTGLKMKTNETLILTPILVSGQNTAELPKLVIKSKLRYKYDLREQTLSGTPIEAVSNRQVNVSNPTYSVVRFDKTVTSVPYTTSIPLKSWMSNAEVQIRQEAFGCCGVPSSTLVSGLNGETQKRTFDPHFRYLTPEKEQEKVRFEIGEAYLDFPQGQSTIRPEFRNNRYELDKINRMLGIIATDPDVRVTSVEMRGYASPEASREFNFDLSYKRAQAMREYFARMSTIPSEMFRTGVGGEDWESLRRLIEDRYYDLPDKWQVLNIIANEPDWDRREQLIKNVGGGTAYRKIFNELYPKLRRVDCQINFVVREFTTEEGKKRIKEQPKLLSQNEMYQIARTYPEGSREFNETLITARQQFPDNDVANLNGAAAALAEGDVELAREYLDKVENTTLPEYHNCIGVLRMYEGRYDEAASHLKTAEQAGLSEATHNLNELAKLKGQTTTGGKKKRK